MNKKSKFIKSDCFLLIDKTSDSDYAVTFIRSGFSGWWIKVMEASDYSTSTQYASDEETIQLNRLMVGKRRTKVIK